MPARVGSAIIDHREYDAIITALRQPGATPESVAASFNRGVTTIQRFVARANGGGSKWRGRQ